MTIRVRFRGALGSARGPRAERPRAVAPRRPVPTTTLVITGLGRGGAETQLVALARHLEARGWPIEIVSLLPVTRFTEARFVAELETRAIPVWSADITGGASAARGLWRLWRHLRGRRPQVLCTFMFHANTAGVVLARLARVPVVVASIRNEHFGPRWRERLEAITQRLCDVTVMNSRRVAASLLARRIVPRDRCRVIFNGLDLGRFAPGDAPARASVRQRLGVPDEAFLWVAVGSLEPQKDRASLLEAAARLRDRCPGVRIAIAGDGPLRAPLQRRSEAMALGDTVHWLGLRHDVPDLLAAGDAYVLSSRWEGSPNAVLEALAAALPVVATDVGGVRELVEDGRSGFLVPPGASEALAAAMVRVMSLPLEQRRRMGRRGRQAIQARHDSRVVLEQWRHLLLDAWHARRPGDA